MKLIAGLLMGLLLGLLPSTVGAACPSGDCVELEGLSAIKVEVVLTVEEKDAFGLTEKGLEDFVAVALRARLPKIKVLDLVEQQELFSENISLPVIQVGVTELSAEVISGGLEDNRAAMVRIELQDTVELGGQRVPTVLWLERKLVVGHISGVQNDIKQWFEDGLTAFAADWNRANPDK
jgi:hypothetical protein